MNFKPINMKIKQEDDGSPLPEESPSDAITTPSSETNIKQEVNQYSPEPQSLPPTQPPINLKKASRETLRRLACEGSLEASELLSERCAKDRAGYEQRKVHLANGRASTLASYERQRENGKRRRREKRKREAEGREKSRGLSEDVAMASIESSEIKEALPEAMAIERLEEDPQASGGADDTGMVRVEEELAKIDEQRWDREICWSIYEALGW